MSEFSGNDLIIGAHTSAAGGVENAIFAASNIGASTCQLFTANQKRWQGKPITDERAAAFHAALEETGLSHIMSHDSYLINLGAPKPENLIKSRKAFKEEIERCLKLGISYLNFHPGARLDSEPEECLDKICESLLECQPLVEGSDLKLLIESTAGQGSTMGRTFDEIGYIVERVKDHLPIGVCVDTCHSFVAGYDLRNLDEALDEFDRVVGLEFLMAFHLNDSVKGLGSRVDRHRPLGEGEIGIELFRDIVQNPRVRHLPMYLETPDGLELWEKEIKLLREFASAKN